MAPGQLLVLLLCMALAEARTVSLEKLAITLSDSESGESDEAVSEILMALLSDQNNASSGLELDLKECHKGSCRLCVKKIVEACFIASVDGSKIKVQITIDRHVLLDTEITAPSKVCKKIDFIPKVSEVCVEFKDVDLKKLYGCVALSIKTQVLPVHFKIGCFKIPTAEKPETIGEGRQPMVQNEATNVLDPSTVLKFLSLNENTSK